MTTLTSIVLLGLAAFVSPAGQKANNPPVKATPTPAPTAQPSATPAATSVWVTGRYRNLFRELGRSDAEIDAKVEGALSAFFHGDESLRCYYPVLPAGSRPRAEPSRLEDPVLPAGSRPRAEPSRPEDPVLPAGSRPRAEPSRLEDPVGSDEAYILDSGNNDIRSEGQAYGMLIAVQAGLRTEFDHLWNYASRRMRHTSGDRQGYFAWHLSPEGVVLDPNSASDGEEFFATALYLAWKRWGDAAYKAAADDILHHMLHQDRYVAAGSTVTRMIDPATKLIVFVPEGQGATFTDPYYNLPAFYELFAHWANADNDYWREVAQASRAYFPTATHPTTGLFPDYSLFNGRPTDPSNSGHTDFRYDAWRVIQSLALDSYWFGLDPWQVNAVDRLQGFFASRGLTTYGHLFTLDGAPLAGGEDHSAGLVAMNAVGSLVATNARAMDFVQDLWTIQPTHGRYRYFDGCLYVLGLLQCSGRFQIIGRPESAHPGTR